MLHGDELEGPRGRIYLIKSVLEERIPLNKTVARHLDSCLSCLACETSCPSGVRYRELIDPVRRRMEEELRRPWMERLHRTLLVHVLPYPQRLRLLMLLALRLRKWARWIPGSPGVMLRLTPKRLPPTWNAETQSRHLPQGARRMRVALLTGCAQRVFGGAINRATVNLLTRLGCEVFTPPQAGCCGALTYHMGERHHSLAAMRRLITCWSDLMHKEGVEWFIVNTSGCGAVVREYGELFAQDAQIAQAAHAVGERVRDVGEIIALLGMPAEAQAPQPLRVACHEPCSLIHAQRLGGSHALLLRQVGFELAPLAEGHLCCGSAGTYNMLQPKNGAALGLRKAEVIARSGAEVVASGNLGCLEQLAHYCPLPMLHSVELLDWATGGPKPIALAHPLS